MNAADHASHGLKRRVRRWRLLPVDEDHQQRLMDRLGMHPVAARVLATRAFSHQPSLLELFLQPRAASLVDPMQMAGMSAAVQRILRAVATKERTIVFGDYDVDGICASTILSQALRVLGASPTVLIPNRFTDGYGLNVALVRAMAAEGPALIITVDTGVAATAEVALARELGLEVVVTDHHLPPENRPAAVAIVNPNLPEAPYPGGPLCGAAVALKLSHALLRESGKVPTEAGKDFLRAHLDLAALATVADVVPLIAENRILVRLGLEQMSARPRPGIAALLEVARHRGNEVNAETVGFTIAPRLNAASRISGDATEAFLLLNTEDPNVARSIANDLEDRNRERRSIESTILSHCLRDIETTGDQDRDVFVVGGRGWHGGVVGTVAARIADFFHRPAVVLTMENGIAKGSARSIPGFDIHEALSACSSHLIQFGGHAAAAGLKLEEKSLPRFREAMQQHTARTITSAELEPVLMLDAELRPEDADWGLFESLESMRPFGEANRSPVFLLRDMRPCEAPMVLAEKHVRFSVQAGSRRIKVIGFSQGSLAGDWQRRGGAMDLAVRLQKNEWRGQESIELQLVEARFPQGE